MDYRAREQEIARTLSKEVGATAPEPNPETCRQTYEAEFATPPAQLERIGFSTSDQNIACIRLVLLASAVFWALFWFGTKTWTNRPDLTPFLGGTAIVSGVLFFVVWFIEATIRRLQRGDHHHRKQQETQRRCTAQGSVTKEPDPEW